MNTQTPEPNAATDGTSHQPPSPPRQSSAGRLFGIVALALVVAIGSWAAYVYVTGEDGFSWRRLTFQEEKPKKIVTYSGQILFNGEPLVNGIVQAYPMDEKGGRPSVGPIGADGKFTLYTDINGTMTKGLPIGEYRLVINAIYPLQLGQLGTTKVLPKEYYQKDTTPISITVEESNDEMQVFKLKGTPANPPPSPKKKTGKKGPSAKLDPAAILRNLMRGDKNGDGKLSREESPARLQQRFDSVDIDKDGFLDQSELEKMFQSRQNGNASTPKKKS